MTYSSTPRGAKRITHDLPPSAPGARPISKKRSQVYRARVTVTLRSSILDPQGKAVEHGINTLGIAAVENVRIGKYIEMNIHARSREEAETIAKEASSKLLANPIMEDFTVEVTKA